MNCTPRLSNIKEITHLNLNVHFYKWIARLRAVRRAIHCSPTRSLIANIDNNNPCFNRYRAVCVYLALRKEHLGFYTAVLDNYLNSGTRNNYHRYSGDYPSKLCKITNTLARSTIQYIFCQVREFLINHHCTINSLPQY